MTATKITAKCRVCGKAHTARVERQWWESDSIRCCGRTDTPWISPAGEIKHNGVFVSVTR